jgi:putative copper export protein
MVAVALVNRFGLGPVVMRTGSNALEAQTFFMALWRNVAIEQLLAVMVIAAVSVLGTLPPAFAGGAP